MLFVRNTPVKQCQMNVKTCFYIFSNSNELILRSLFDPCPTEGRHRLSVRLLVRQEWVISFFWYLNDGR